MILNHLYREGLFDVAETLAEEAGLPEDAAQEAKEKFSEMHRHLELVRRTPYHCSACPAPSKELVAVRAPRTHEDSTSGCDTAEKFRMGSVVCAFSQLACKTGASCRIRIDPAWRLMEYNS